ncbi:hypothetical protein ACRQ1B_25655 [Rhizobium panacihumi]|uniref:hypothetical protein n=1 Tax=Rhizobium panacihumi TaxID=2008450 RepID=UPI003D78FEC7
MTINDNAANLLTGAKNSSFSGIFALCQVMNSKSLNSLKKFSCDDSAQQNAPKNQPQSQWRHNECNQRVKAPTQPKSGFHQPKFCANHTRIPQQNATPSPAAITQLRMRQYRSALYRHETTERRRITQGTKSARRRRAERKRSIKF